MKIHNYGNDYVQAYKFKKEVNNGTNNETEATGKGTANSTATSESQEASNQNKKKISDKKKANN